MRKFVLVMTALFVVAIIAVTTTACGFSRGLFDLMTGEYEDDYDSSDDNSSDEEVGLLEDGMTLSEAKSALKGISNYSLHYSERAYELGGIEMDYQFCQNGTSCQYDDFEMANFYEGSRYYDLYVIDGSRDYEITDYDGYDYDFSLIGKDRRYSMDVVFDKATEKGVTFKVEDGMIYVGDDDFTITVFDISETSLKIPSQYANYKSMRETDPVVQTKPLNNDSSKLVITNIGDFVKTLEVPSEIDRKQVVEIDGDAFNTICRITNITVPISITKISTAFSGLKYLTTINYGGSTSSWRSMTKKYDWQPSTDYCVYCTDGTIRK